MIDVLVYRELSKLFLLEFFDISFSPIASPYQFGNFAAAVGRRHTEIHKKFDSATITSVTSASAHRNSPTISFEGNGHLLNLDTDWITDMLTSRSSQRGDGSSTVNRLPPPPPKIILQSSSNTRLAWIEARKRFPQASKVSVHL